MALGERGNLRQVGDAEDLPAGGERAQVLADRTRGVAADPGVDLVEHEQRAGAGRRPGSAVRHAEQRQHHPRQLAARGDLAQRARRARPAFGAIRSSTVVGPARAAAVGARRELDLERGVGHRQLGQPLADRGGELRGRLRAASRSSPASASSSAARPRARASASSSATSALLELVAPRAAALGVREHLGDRAAVLALEPREQRQPLLDLLETRRAGIAVSSSRQ